MSAGAATPALAQQLGKVRAPVIVGVTQEGTFGATFLPLGDQGQSEHLAIGQPRLPATPHRLERGEVLLVQVVHDAVDCGEKGVQVELHGCNLRDGLHNHASTWHLSQLPPQLPSTPTICITRHGERGCSASLPGPVPRMPGISHPSSGRWAGRRSHYIAYEGANPDQRRGPYPKTLSRNHQFHLFSRGTGSVQ